MLLVAVLYSTISTLTSIARPSKYIRQNDFYHLTLKKGIERIKSINGRKISRAVFLNTSSTVLRAGDI